MEEIIKKILIEEMRKVLKKEIILEDINRKTHELFENEYDAIRLNFLKEFLEELEQEEPDFEMLSNWIENFLEKNKNEE